MKVMNHSHLLAKGMALKPQSNFPAELRTFGWIGVAGSAFEKVFTSTGDMVTNHL